MFGCKLRYQAREQERHLQAQHEHFIDFSLQHVHFTTFVAIYKYWIPYGFFILRKLSMAVCLFCLLIYWESIRFLWSQSFYLKSRVNGVYTHITNRTKRHSWTWTPKGKKHRWIISKWNLKVDDGRIIIFVKYFWP